MLIEIRKLAGNRALCIQKMIGTHGDSHTACTTQVAGKATVDMRGALRSLQKHELHLGCRHRLPVDESLMVAHIDAVAVRTRFATGRAIEDCRQQKLVIRKENVVNGNAHHEQKCGDEHEGNEMRQFLHSDKPSTS